MMSASDFLLSAAAANLITVAIGFFWSSGRLPWRFLTVALLALSFLNTGKSTMRSRYWGNEDAPAEQRSLRDLPRSYEEWIEVSYRSILENGAEPGDSSSLPELSAKKNQTLLDRIDNLQNLLFVIDAIRTDHIKPLEGRTYALIPPLLMPRILWPDKPRTHEGQVLLNVHFGRQDLESTFTTYIAWGLLPEAYGNFGAVTGSILLGAFLGILFAWIENLTARKLAGLDGGIPLPQPADQHPEFVRDGGERPGHLDLPIVRGDRGRQPAFRPSQHPAAPPAGGALNPPPSPPNPRKSRLAGAARVLTLGWSDTPRGRLLLRRGEARAVRTLLRLRSRRFQPRRVGSALVVAPHPDDETFGCGGALALLARAGAALDVAFVTDGAASHPGHPTVAPGAIAARRRAEARRATQILGVNPQRVWFLDESDGTLARLEAGAARQAAARIAGLLARLAPDAVLLPCRRDGSSEHDAAFALVARALGETDLSPRILEFPVWSWWNPRRLVRPLLTARRVWRLDLGPAFELKRRAVSCYVSQTEPIPPDTAAALPAGFASMFLRGEEFLFER